MQEIFEYITVWMNPYLIRIVTFKKISLDYLCIVYFLGWEDRKKADTYHHAIYLLKSALADIFLLSLTDCLTNYLSMSILLLVLNVEIVEMTCWIVKSSLSPDDSLSRGFLFQGLTVLCISYSFDFTILYFRKY